MPDIANAQNMYMHVDPASLQQALQAQEANRLRTEALAAWSPPIIQDPTTLTSRAATQADIDRLVLIERAYTDLRRVLADHQRYYDTP